MADGVPVLIDPQHHAAITRDPEKQRRLAACATDFREFLREWHYVNGETGRVQVLGDDLWAGQQRFADLMMRERFIYGLKARKTGYTTIETAFDGWVARFRDVNARVHLFSRRDKAAQEILRAVRFGLDRLPVWMQLPYQGKPKVDEIAMWGGPRAGVDDVRRVVAYPADEDTAVESTATHGHVDEWARMGNPERVWQAIEPSMANTCHILTTGLGPTNYSGVYWRKTVAGDTPFTPFFTSALERAGRDEAWLAAKRRALSEKHFRQEFPMTWEDALFGGGDYQFPREHLDTCCRGGGPEAPEAGHRYSIGWDIGRHRDAAVGVVIDMTDKPHEVVEYVRLREVPYPGIQLRIEDHWRRYGGPRCRLLVEKNGPGEAVLENLDLPEKVVEDAGFTTSKPSKSKIIENLTVGFQTGALHYSARAWPQLDSELRGYQVPDDDVIQDSVMALAIAYSESYGAGVRGRVRKILKW